MLVFLLFVAGVPFVAGSVYKQRSNSQLANGCFALAGLSIGGMVLVATAS